MHGGVSKDILFLNLVNRESESEIKNLNGNRGLCARHVLFLCSLLFSIVYFCFVFS